MKINWNKRYTTIAVYCVLVVFASLILISIILNMGNVTGYITKFLSIFNPLIYGLVIAFLVNPLMRFFENKIFSFWSQTTKNFKIRRIVAMLCAFVLVIAFIAMFFAVLVPQIADSYKELEGKVGGYVTNTETWITELFSEDGPLPKWLTDYAKDKELTKTLTGMVSDSTDVIAKVADAIVSFIIGIVVQLKDFLIGLIFSIYFLFSKEKLIANCKKIMYAFLSKKHVSKILRLSKITKSNFEGFIIGKIIDSLIIGVLTFFVLMIVGMPYYPLIALIVGVTNVIPFFGPFIGAIPSAFIIFIADPIMALWFCLIILAIQQLDGNVIGPKILGVNTSLSALGVMIAIVLMTGVLGVTGMFIGVPIFAVLYAIFYDMVDKRIIARGKSRNVDDYIGEGRGNLKPKDESTSFDSDRSEKN